MGIRNPFARNQRKNAEIRRFRNGLPRQCEHWLAMTGFFDSLKASRFRGRLFFYPWDTVPGAQWAFLNTVSGAEMTTLVLSATEPVRNALPPTTECSPITVSPPRMDAPE